MRKRDIESKQRRLAKEYRKAERENEEREKELDRLARLHCGFSEGDEVVYNGPNPERFLHGIVRRVCCGHGATPPAVVTVRPFLKGKKRKLSRAWHTPRKFTKPEHLKLIAKADKVAPYEK